MPCVPVNLHIRPSITNKMSTSNVDISHIRNIRNLKVADPAFNTPGKFDVPLGAYVREDVMVENEIRDHRVTTHQ